MNGKSKPGSYLKEYSWQEVRQHTSPKDRWVVIDDVIYDVTEWQKRHPGGARILGHYAGQDATVSARIYLFRFNTRILYIDVYIHLYACM